jgi:hypothetical protein
MPKEPTPQTSARQDLVSFLNAIGNVHADRVNPAFRSRYSSLPEILESVKSVAKNYNLAVHQTLSSTEGTIRVTTEFLHADGSSHPGGSVAFKSEGLNPQQLASATTYLRRLCLKTAVGIETDLDDDGSAASKPAPPQVSTPAIGQGNYQRQDDKKITSPWYSFLSAVEAERAHEYLVKKGWLSANAQDLEELPAEKVALIIENKPAFLKAIK